ncbi:MAG TPA: gluconate 2-dehydrogenase subunit 3 family protein [Rhizomicrobium sp.]|nr:gluconate 2-dehydrogenase subunit 3 family protein [Rhizomicrobium sp.]
MSEISRRDTLAWVAAAFASPWIVAPVEPAFAQEPLGLWKDVPVQPATASGYGTDPNLQKPVVPWPLTLTPEQRESLRISADLMIPADDRSPSGAALNLDAFIDEWISAPYPDQQRDRWLFLSGLAWLDAESNARFHHAFAAASDSERRAIFDDIAFRGRIKPGYGRPAFFFQRLRGLMLGGFFSRPEGMKDIGYIGNTPMQEYPGPPDEALAHLNAALAGLGIKPVA